MPRGERVRLRARIEADAPVLGSMHDDVETTARSDPGGWRPISPGTKATRNPESSDEVAHFAIVTSASDELVGIALLWGIDMFHRTAHVGIGLLPDYQGRGLGTDAVGVLCHYGFVVLGLHRIQIETVAGNHAMRRAAQRNGFVLDALLRRHVSILGEPTDLLVLGLLAHEWVARRQVA
jgi:RimJ/RimL family protein N-acetyltransferase